MFLWLFKPSYKLSLMNDMLGVVKAAVNYVVSRHVTPRATTHWTLCQYHTF